ncbi:hypothetical protein [Merismopedia glauca]|uniref:Uncharacterized protein n=1 Tax=Merismopedia glauca CCAP 1448/3 TaxID=1296344 RepID=A0A2T1CAJ1_9CYAN|nr:hypothetical protein [Merismopedia glauca]PSB05264.1 hypothetical protein C7B64_00220 [Merismopedia glauca CCAP 1448/3]
MLPLYDLLKKIQEKPGLYIGYPSISNLFMFLCGYQYSLQELQLPISEQEQEFQKFQPWLQEKFQVKTSASWAKIILLFSTDEDRAFTSFFDLLEEFWQQQKPATEKLKLRLASEAIKSETPASTL